MNAQCNNKVTVSCIASQSWENPMVLQPCAVLLLCSHELVLLHVLL